MKQEDHIRQTVQKSVDAFWKTQTSQSLSLWEFLCSQFCYIKKHWWIVQCGCLVLLWNILQAGFSGTVQRKAIAILIPCFALMILPELWKTREYHMEEIENVSIYTTKDIYMARLLLFGFFDLMGMTVLFVSLQATGIENLILEMLIPFNGVCIVLIGSLSLYKGTGFYLPLCMSFVFIIGWYLFISNEYLYSMISYPLWIVFFISSVCILVGSIFYLLRNCKENMVWN